MTRSIPRALTAVAATVAAVTVSLALTTQQASAHTKCPHKTTALPVVKVLGLPAYDARKVFTGSYRQGNFVIHNYKEQRRLTLGVFGKKKKVTKSNPWSSAPIPMGAGKVTQCVVRVAG